jgi:hypothetical protein
MKADIYTEHAIHLEFRSAGPPIGAQVTIQTDTILFNNDPAAQKGEVQT